LGAIVFWTLSDKPEEATWLRNDERDWLLGKLAEEHRQDASMPISTIWQVVFSGRIWMLSLVYFGVSTTMYGVTLWLPTVIRAFSGLSYLWTGVVAVAPFLVTVVAMVLVGMHSDRRGERRWHTAGPAFAAAVGLIIAGYAHSTLMVVSGIGLGLAAAESMCGPFWAMATSRMTGLSAAAGIAVINSLANLGGYFGPDIIGFFRSDHGGFRGGLLAIAATVTLSGIAALIVGRPTAPTRSD
jgi:MFS transporter, ACS family, tartrate transporter